MESAATRVLFSPTITEGIFEHLSPGPCPLVRDRSVTKCRRECQEALARLAAVCRAMCAPALDALWRHVDDFSHLLYAIGPSYNRKQKMLADIVSDEQWARFQEYALRVRSLNVGNAAGNIHNNVLTFLSCMCSQEALLPRLVRLTGLSIDSVTTSYRFLYASTIRQLHVRSDDHMASAGVIRMALEPAKHALTSIVELLIDGTPNITRPVISYWTLPQLRTLKVMDTSPLSVEAICALAAFPNLRTLGLSLAPGIPDIPEDERPTGFSSLQELELRGNAVDAMRLLSIISPPHLQTIVLSSQLCGDRRSPTPIDQLFQPLSYSLPLSLQSFRASFDCTSGCCLSVRIGPLLAALCPIQQLRSVVFSCGGLPFELSDDDLHQAQDAWPDLTEFEVDGGICIWSSTYNSGPRRHGRRMRSRSHDRPVSVQSPTAGRRLRRRVYAQGSRYLVSDDEDWPADGEDSSFLTVSSLAAFAHTHPHLERLVIPSLSLDLVPDLDSVPILDHPLRHLRICYLTPGIPVYPCALILDLLFPHLDLSSTRLARAELRDGTGGATNELNLVLLGLQAGRIGTHRKRAATLDDFRGTIPMPSPLPPSPRTPASRGQTPQDGPSSVYPLPFDEVFPYEHSPERIWSPPVRHGGSRRSRSRDWDYD
ncbi:hypothetical protein OH77DRAFT_830495 [Trametes cingulata]|nr:hypothetical protein OH77DRAFT_830495 [Trametes cingulata]